jgi:hypothetical protein
VAVAVRVCVNMCVCVYAKIFEFSHVFAFG